MAGGIPDTEEDRFVLLLGSIEGLGSPWIPIDRIVGML
jgi:hypothetical protein